MADESTRREFTQHAAAALAAAAVLTHARPTPGRESKTGGAAVPETPPKYPARETGLVVVDPLNDFLSEGGKVWNELKEVVTAVGVVPNLKALIGGARQRGVRVFYAPMCTYPHDYKGWKFLSPGNARALKEQIFEAGSWGADWHPDLKPQKDDIVVAPHKTSCAFVGTELDLRLRQHGVERVVLAGMVANTCVESTGRHAVELGYHVTFVKDAVGALTWEAQKAAVEVNYPIYGNAVLTVKEFLAAVA